MIFVSIIIPTKDRPEAVDNAVRSVLSGEWQKFEMFVIDQSKNDATEETLAGLHTDPRFHYHRNLRPGVGAASSRNIGIALSSGPILAVIDDDVTVQPDWLGRIVAEFAADPELQFICGKLTAPPYDWRQGYTPAFDARPGLSRWKMPIEAAGANFSMRRSLLSRVGGYDEFCGPGSRLGASDDGDLTWRIVRSGAKWRACAHIEVVHTFGFRPSTDGAALLKRYQIGVGGNFGRFTRRGDWLAATYFFAWQAWAATRGAALMLRGRRGQGLGWVGDRLVGFRRGFLLPPGEGFVSGTDLDTLRAQLSSHTGASMEEGHGA